MAKWIDGHDNEMYLVDPEKMLILGYVMNRRGEWISRKLTVPALYVENAPIIFGGWARVLVGINHATKEGAMKQLQEDLKIFEIDYAAGEANILKILAQMKNVEIFGKLEVVIRIEGLPPAPKSGG
jgi:hypothetical protein